MLTHRVLDWRNNVKMNVNAAKNLPWLETVSIQSKKGLECQCLQRQLCLAWFWDNIGLQGALIKTLAVLSHRAYCPPPHSLKYLKGEIGVGRRGTAN